MTELFTDFTDISSLRANRSLTEQKVTQSIPNTTLKVESAQIKALEAKILLTMKSREGKVNLMNAYLARMQSIVGNEC